MESTIENESMSRKPWSPFALTAFMLILGLFILALLGLRGTGGRKPTETDFQKVYAGDGSVKLYFFMQGQTAQFDRAPNTVFKSRQDPLQSAYRLYNIAINVQHPAPGAIRRAGVLTYAVKHTGEIPVFNRLEAPATLKDLPKPDVSELHSEAAMWRDIYSGSLNPTKVESYAGRIKKLDIGPAKYLALQQLYLKAGDKARANSIISSAEKNAVSSLMAFALLLFVLLLAGLGGIVLIILFLLYFNKWIPNPDKPRETVPSDALFKAFVAYLSTFWILSLSSLFLRPWAETLSSSQRIMYLAIYSSLGTAVGGLVALAVLNALVKRAGYTLQDVGLSLSDFAANFIWGICGYCAMLPVLVTAVIIWQIISTTFLKNVQTPEHPVIRLFTSGNPLVVALALIAASVLAPIFEETFFRGTFYGGLRSKLPVWIATIVSGAGFALLHPFPAGFLPILAIGSVFAIIFEARRSLIPTMIAHAIHNTVSFLLFYLLFR